jgi:transcriptional regulator with XRE-family HTH domain
MRWPPSHQNNLTQEKLAEQLSVSRQAIQKWESGAGTPDLDNLIKIAKRFSVTSTRWVLDSDRRICEGNAQRCAAQPEYSAMDTWESYAADLMVEFRQCVDEGLDISTYDLLVLRVHQCPPDR